jgi:hypothetical protein
LTFWPQITVFEWITETPCANAPWLSQIKLTFKVNSSGHSFKSIVTNEIVDVITKIDIKLQKIYCFYSKTILFKQACAIFPVCLLIQKYFKTPWYGSRNPKIGLTLIIVWCQYQNLYLELKLRTIKLQKLYWLSFK